MAVLGWILLGLAAAVLAGGIRPDERDRAALLGRCASGVGGAVLAGLIATAAGLGSIGDFFHTGVWLVALAGAVLALVAHEMATGTRRADETDLPPPNAWAGESESLDRNW
jgi:uncharacterized membrane protein YeaQ/YmgE (transglycosylase-associated protein family)